MLSPEKRHALDKEQWAWQWCNTSSCIVLYWIYTALNAHCPALSYIRTYRSKKCEAFASLGATATSWASIRYTVWEPFTWLPACIRMRFCTADKCLRCWFFLLPFLSMGIQTMTFITIFAQTASRLMDCDVAKLTYGSCWCLLPLASVDDSQDSDIDRRNTVVPMVLGGGKKAQSKRMHGDNTTTKTLQQHLQLDVGSSCDIY